MSNRHTEHFNPITDKHLHCSCCGKGQVSIATFILLEVVHEHFGKPVTINSGPRCKKHNAAIGGAKHSEHLIVSDDDGTMIDTDAVDITVKDVTPQAVYMFLKSLPYANLLGIGKYKTFTHVDTRGYGARW